MSTKTQLETLQNTNLASGSSIPASSHRAVLNTNEHSLLENIYGTPLTDTNGTTNVFTFSGAGKTYRFRIFKQGRKVTVNGYVTNTSGLTLPSGTTFFSITNTEYLQETQNYFFCGVSSLDSSNIRFTLIYNEFKTASSIGSGETIHVNFEYNTLN